MSGYGATSGRSSLSAMEFDDTLKRISDNITQINRCVANLENYKQQIGTPSDSKDRRADVNQREQKTNDIIKSTRNMLVQLSNCSVTDRKLRMQGERMKIEFRNAVDRYSQIQKSLVLKMSSLSTTTQDTAPLIDFDGDGRQMNGGSQKSQQMHRTTDLALQLEREEEMRKLTNQIIDVQDLFTDLSQLVFDQREQVDSIENNTDIAAADVEAGNQQLASAVRSRNAYRKKCCILIIILLVILAIIGIVLAVHFGGNNKK